MKISRVAMSVLGLAILTGAHAGGLGESTSAKVRFADLNLDSAKGVSVLYGRVSSAAPACQNWSLRNLIFTDLKPAMGQYQHCLDKAMSGAVAKIDRPAF